jgi:hypothetical protein
MAPFSRYLSDPRDADATRNKTLRRDLALILMLFVEYRLCHSEISRHRACEMPGKRVTIKGDTRYPTLGYDGVCRAGTRVAGNAPHGRKKPNGGMSFKDFFCNL